MKYDDENLPEMDESRYIHPKNWRIKYLWKQYRSMIILCGILLFVVLFIGGSVLINVRSYWKNEKTRLKNMMVGDTISFGGYGEKSEWYVLAEENGQFLLLSKNIAATCAYGANSQIGYPWGDSDLRDVINEKLLTRWFLQRELDLVVKKQLSPEGTIDQVFILSKEEVEQYVPEEYRTVYDEDGNVYSWWLRDRGEEEGNMIVNAGGYINTKGIATSEKDVGLRIAIWLDMSIIQYLK